MKNLFYFLITGMFAVALFLGSCEKVVYPPIEVPDTVSYSLDIQPIWDSKCTDCHGINPDLSPDVSYNNLINGGYINTEDPPESELMKKLYSGSHDARALEEEKLLILKWIELVAENN